MTDRFYVDLSGIESGILSRQERFGYLSIPAGRRGVEITQSVVRIANGDF
jgi:hypothetical protein